MVRLYYTVFQVYLQANTARSSRETRQQEYNSPFRGKAGHYAAIARIPYNGNITVCPKDEAPPESRDSEAFGCIMYPEKRIIWKGAF